MMWPLYTSFVLACFTGTFGFYFPNSHPSNGIELQQPFTHHFTHSLKPSLTSQFNWAAVGSYTAKGRIQASQLYPTVTIISPETDVVLAVDVENQIIAIRTNSTSGSQFVTPQGYVFALPNPVVGQPPILLSNPVGTYVNYTGSYLQATNTDVDEEIKGHHFRIVRTYTGFVKDPGACGFYGATTIKTIDQGYVHVYSLSQTAFSQPLTSCIKYVVTAVFDEFIPGPPDPIWTTIPFSPNGTIPAYCFAFFPPPPAPQCGQLSV